MVSTQVHMYLRMADARGGREQRTVEDGWLVLIREPVGGVGQEKARLANSSISYHDTL
jgi:hypothetical protein